MDYFGIIKRAYQLTIKHKFLWIFGILAGGFGSGLGSFKSNMANYTTSNPDWANKLASPNLASFWQIWGGLVITLAVLVGALSIILFILKIASQGALIGSVDDLDKGEKGNFGEGLKIGFRYFWRILGVLVLYVLMVLASIVVWLGPAILLAVFGQIALAFIWGSLLLFVSLAFWILVGLISPYSLRLVVLEKKRVWESIRGGLHLFRDFWKEVIVMYLLLFAISLGFGIAYLMAILIAGGILFAIGFGVYLASPPVAIGYGILVGLGFLAALVTVSGAYNSFHSAVLTLTYSQLAKKS